MRLSLLRTAFLAAALLCAGSASAVPIEYAVEMGDEPEGFAFSYIHAATSGDGQFFYSGALLFKLKGTITGVYDTDTDILTLDEDIHLIATGIGGGFSGMWDFAITGGTLTNTDPGTPPANTNLFEGSFSYTLTSPDMVPVEASGMFHFFAVDFPGSPNTLTTSQLAAWGNNWNKDTGGPPGPGGNGLGQLGVDIRAQGTVIPEPTGFIVFGIGALVASAGAATRRRRETAA
jgi:hypothetical protein